MLIAAVLLTVELGWFLEIEMIKTKHAGLLNALNEMQASPAYAARRSVLEMAEATIVTQEQMIAAKQAEIDRLMLEYCPDEMTPEQLQEYEERQQAVPPNASAQGPRSGPAGATGSTT